jgi:chromosome partitioning protein
MHKPGVPSSVGLSSIPDPGANPVTELPDNALREEGQHATAHIPSGATQGLNRIITISNAKGGVCKTTAAISLAGEAASSGLRVLLIDAAPQASATLSLMPADAIHANKGLTLYNWVRGDADFTDLIHTMRYESYTFDIVPGHKNNDEIDRSNALEVLPAFRDMFENWQSPYDYIFIDTDPSYGILVSMAYMGSQYVLCPVKADLLSTGGAAQLKSQVDKARSFNKSANPTLLGFFLTFFDPRKRSCRDVQDFFRASFPGHFLETVIPDNVRLAETVGMKAPVNLAFPDSKGALAYHNLWMEVKSRVTQSQAAATGVV